MYAATLAESSAEHFVVRIVRHCFVDELSQLRNRFVAGEWVGVVFGRPFASFAVAAGTLVAIDLFAQYLPPEGKR